MYSYPERDESCEGLCLLFLFYWRARFLLFVFSENTDAAEAEQKPGDEECESNPKGTPCKNVQCLFYTRGAMWHLVSGLKWFFS